MAAIALWRVSRKILPPCRNISSKSKALLSTGVANRQFSCYVFKYMRTSFKWPISQTSKGNFGVAVVLVSVSDGRYSSLSGLRRLHLSGRLRLDVTVYGPTFAGSIPNALYWKKDVGDPVGVGDTIATVESDKATMDVISPVVGVIKTILVQEGGEVTSGEPLATIRTGLARDGAPAALKTEAPASTASPLSATPEKP